MPGLMRASRGLHWGAHETAGQGKDGPACATAPGLRGRGRRTFTGSDGVSGNGSRGGAGKVAGQNTEGLVFQAQAWRGTRNKYVFTTETELI